MPFQATLATLSISTFFVGPHTNIIIPCYIPNVFKVKTYDGLVDYNENLNEAH